MYSPTIEALEKFDDQHDFERMCADVLNAEDYRDVIPIAPRGGSDEGKDITFTTRDGRKGLGCATIGYKDDIERKFYADFSQRKSGEYQVYIFFCTAYVSSAKKKEFRQYVSENLHAELIIHDMEALRSLLDTTCQDIRKRFLDIDVEHHNWASLLTACKGQRRKILKRYSGKYEPSLYVRRHTEQKIDTWYRQAVIALRQGKTKAQLLTIVDQAGAGKTNMVLHLSEEYGRDAPALVIPGSHTITDDHSLEREIVEAVGYPVDSRTYHAKVHELCQIAQQEGYPLLVIVEGINENSNLMEMRNALEQVLIACQDYPLLLLITCRDAVWSLIQSTTLRKFASEEQGQYPENGVVHLGMYDDDEFEQARKKYFAQHNVGVTLSVEAAQSLRSPLLLSIFAEVNQNCPFKFVPTVVDKDLWDKYLETKIDAIHEAMGRNISKRAISGAIEHIALQMLKRNRLSLSLDDLAGINHIDPDATSPHSLFLQLKNAAVLFEDTSETISFIYETFLEFVIGKALAQAFEKPEERERVLVLVEGLARTYRWRQIPPYIAELVSEPDAIVECLRSSNVWLAAQALKRAPTLVSIEVRQQVIADLEKKLKSKFTLDRSRAAELLGLLGASGSKDQLFHCWSVYGSSAALRALARLGLEEIVEPFIRYLGRFLEWYLPDDQELVDTLPASFRWQLRDKALALLNDSEQMFAAAHTLGFLKATQAVAPLLTHLETTEWCDWVALLALLQFGTQEAFDALKTALGELGIKLSLSEQQVSTGSQEEVRQTCNDLYGVLSQVRVRGLQHCPLDKIVPFLSHLLEHPNYYVRSEAIQSLGHLGACETALAIVQSVQYGAGWSRMEIHQALHTFGTQIAIEPILALVNDPSTPDTVLSVAIEALGVSRDERVLEPLSTFITQRRFLFEVIQALGNTRLPGAIPILVQILQDKTITSTNQGSLSRENLENMAIENLGKLQHPNAFEPVEQFTRTNLPIVWYASISALAASDGERALPLLQELWELDPEKHKAILEALLWIGSKAATNKILELLSPFDGEKAALLASALSFGRGLVGFASTTYRIGMFESTDDRLVTIIDTYFDEMTPDGMLRALFAMEYIATPPARQLLERIAGNPKYDIPRPNTPPASRQTLRDVAILTLCDLGSGAVIEAVLDTLSNQPVNVIEFRLTKMEHGLVRDALQRRLNSAKDNILIPLLTLLGTFGDPTVLPDLKPYIDDPKREVADAAYMAEQRILGLAYF